MRSVVYRSAVLVLAAVIGCGGTGGGDARDLKNLIVDQLKIPVETVEITSDTTAVGTLVGGEKLAIRWKRTPNKIQCLCQKPKAQAEDDVRQLISRLGYKAKSVDIKPSPTGVGYVGEATTDDGVSLDVTDQTVTDAINFTSSTCVAVTPRSYPQFAKKALERELNVNVTEDAAIQAGDFPPPKPGAFDGLLFDVKKSVFQGRFKANGKWYAVELFRELSGQQEAADSFKLRISYRELP